MKKFSFILVILNINILACNSNLLSKIMHSKEKPSSKPHQAKQSTSFKHFSKEHLRKITSKKNSDQGKASMVNKDIMGEIKGVDKILKDKDVFSEMEQNISKEIQQNKERLAKEREREQKQKKAKQRKLKEEKRKKKLEARKTQQKKSQRVRQRLLRRLEHLDTPAQINKLKKIYKNYGIDIKKLNLSDLKFLVNNSKKLLQTYYNPQAMRSCLNRHWQ